MYKRQVTMRLKADSEAEFTRIIRDEIAPLLARQRGFLDRTTSIASARSEAVDTSFWETREAAEAYGRGAYPRVLQALSKVVEGAPRVRTFEVADATFPGARRKPSEGQRL